MFRLLCVQTTLFQDDLFPATAVSWESCLSAADWCVGSNARQPRVSLQPEDMETRERPHVVYLYLRDLIVEQRCYCKNIYL